MSARSIVLPARNPFWIVTALFWAAGAYLWLVPLIDPRGTVWGHYLRRDILLGVPIAAFAVAMTLVLAAPAPYRRKVAFFAVATAFSAGAPLLAFDFGYAMFVLGAWKSNYWLDRAHIPRLYSMPDPQLGFLRKPGITWTGYHEGRVIHYRTDENGFRNPPGVKKAAVVFVGDSFTEAAQVQEDETFVQLVGKRSGLGVANLGRGAYGPQQVAIVIERYALGYQPRAIVWQFFIGNDMSDAEEFAAWRRDPDSRPLSLVRRYFNNSLIKLWARDFLDLRAQGTAPARLLDTGGTEREIVIRYQIGPAMLDEPLREIRAALERGRRLCRSKGIRLVVVCIPTMLNALKPYIRIDDPAERERLLGAPMAGETTAFAARLGEFSKELGIEFIDLLPAFRRAADQQTRGLYIPSDEHLDVRGHEVVAAEVLKWLN